MAILITISATGTSDAFTVMGNGFDLGLTMTGTNSVTVEQDIGGAWYTVGSAITTTGGTSVTANSRPATFRLNCGTFDTSDITGAIEGNVVEGALTIAA